MDVKYFILYHHLSVSMVPKPGADIQFVHINKNDPTFIDPGR